MTTLHDAFDLWVSQAYTEGGRAKRRDQRGTFENGWLDFRMGVPDAKRRSLPSDARAAYMAGRQASVLAKKSEAKGE